MGEPIGGPPGSNGLEERPLRVMHFGTFDRGVGRNALVADGLRAVGVQVIPCHLPLWKDTADKVAAVRSGWRGLPSMTWRLLRIWRKLARAERRIGPVDVILVGSTGHPDLPLARYVADRRRVPLVFDPLVSISETVSDRGLVRPGSAIHRVVRSLERVLFALPDLVVVDTAAHARAWSHEIGLDAGRTVVLPVGAPSAAERVQAYAAGAGRVGFRRSAERPLRVVYFGQFIPLHGLEYVVMAAESLRHREDIVIELHGHGQRLAAVRAMVAGRGLTNVRIDATWRPLDRLLREVVAEADICLGIFGDRPKSARVIPYKVHLALAAGRPVITRGSPAVESALGPHPPVVTVPAADPGALAAAIQELADDPTRREELADAGRSLHMARFRPTVTGRRLRDALRDLVVHPPVPEGPRHRWRTDRVARALRSSRPAGTIVDVGCGTGRTSALIAGRTAPPAGGARHVIALDDALHRVRRAKERFTAMGLDERTGAVVADARALPFRSATDQHGGTVHDGIAAALCAEVLEHVEDDRAVARELARVVADDGVVVVSVPAGPGRFSVVDRMAGHRRRYDRGRLVGMLLSAGLSPVDLRVWGVPFGRIYDRWIQRPALTGGSAMQRAFRLATRAIPPLGIWTALFRIDQRLEPWATRWGGPAGVGSGWLVVARRLPNGRGPTDAGRRASSADPVATGRAERGAEDGAVADTGRRMRAGPRVGSR